MIPILFLNFWLNYYFSHFDGDERTVVRRGGRKGGTNTAIPHIVAREYRNTASKFSQIPKPQLQIGKS